jgi:O-antigen/teichoic acid export membrane protein
MNSGEKIMTTGKSYQSEIVLITKNAGITAFGFLFLNLISLVSNALITRYLGSGQYGLFVLLTRILEILTIISSLGFSNTIVRYVASYFSRGDYQRVKGTVFYSLKMVLIFSIFLAAAIILFSQTISERLFDTSELSRFFSILMLSLPFSVISMVYLSTLNGLKQVKHVVIIKNFINPVIYILMIGIVLFFDCGLNGMIWIYLLTGSFTAMLAYSQVRSVFFKKKTGIIPLTEKKKLWEFSLPMLFIQIFNSTIRLVPIFIMGVYLPTSDIGIFNICLKIALIVSFSLEAFYMIFAPVISELFSKNDLLMVENLYKTVTKWIFTFSLVVFFIIVLFPYSLLIVFGAEFITGTGILIIMAAGELINASVGLVGIVIMMSGRPKIILYNSILSFLIVSLLCVVLIPRYGAVGAALSVAVTVALINIIRLVELYWFEKIHPFKKSYFKPLISGFVSFIITYFIFAQLGLALYFELCIGSLFFLIVFVLCNWILRLDEEDKYILKTLLNQIKR